jgi:sulfatase modifying factor 1
MVWVPEGGFLMGSDDQRDYGKPQRRVHLDGYFIYRHPVTVAQYARFCQATSHAMPPKPRWGWRADHPIVNISWEDAAAYSAWGDVSLPTEAEWEKAARGTDGRKNPWGNDWDQERCWCSHNEIGDAGSTCPISFRAGGASPCGALHMAGNVWEWCRDWYGVDYDRTTRDQNPAGPHIGDRRVFRGGSWANVGRGASYCIRRNSGHPDHHGNDLGFRCVSHPSSKS